VDERRRREPGCRVRILEIGAGTGATSEPVFAALRTRESAVEEYVFTDISKAFLTVAQKALADRPSYLRYEAFDIEVPAAQQGIALDRYDLVIASNVVHATKDIAQSLRNVKAVLRTNGLLLLNELTTNSWFHHLTFGLLDGWWRFEDREIRIPGGPALRPEDWQGVLEAEGFRSVLFPAEAAHAFGQQVVVAESDGFVRQEAVHAPSLLPEHAAAEAPRSGQQRAPRRGLDPTAAGLAELMAGPREAAAETLLLHLRLRVAETLGAEEASLDSRSRPFAGVLLGELGMDSLSSNSLRNTLRQELGVDVAVHRILGERVDGIVGALYEQLLLKLVSNETRIAAGEETETFVF
jgi:SAM-dependent methyltransferase